jgi:hypothetical protein
MLPCIVCGEKSGTSIAWKFRIFVAKRGLVAQAGAIAEALGAALAAAAAGGEFFGGEGGAGAVAKLLAQLGGCGRACAGSRAGFGDGTACAARAARPSAGSVSVARRVRDVGQQDRHRYRSNRYAHSLPDFHVRFSRVHFAAPSVRARARSSRSLHWGYTEPREKVTWRAQGDGRIPVSLT